MERIADFIEYIQPFTEVVGLIASTMTIVVGLGVIGRLVLSQVPFRLTRRALSTDDSKPLSVQLAVYLQTLVIEEDRIRTRLTEIGKEREELVNVVRAMVPLDVAEPPGNSTALQEARE